MAHGREELGDVQGEDGGVEPLVPVFCDQVHENETDVRSGMPADTPKLAVVEEIVLLRFELHPLGNDLGKELADRVQEGYGSQRFRNVVCWFLGLGDDARDGVFQLMRPDAFVDDSVKEGGKGVKRRLEALATSRSMSCAQSPATTPSHSPITVA